MMHCYSNPSPNPSYRYLFDEYPRATVGNSLAVALLAGHEPTRKITMGFQSIRSKGGGGVARRNLRRVVGDHFTPLAQLAAP